MDPISMAFAAYLNFVSDTTHEHMTDLIGLEVSALSIQHHGFDIPFQYQMWRIKDKSVCYSYSNNIQIYSKCTVAAKQLFSGLCNELQRNPETGWRYKKTKNMYCNAAVSYRPIIAEISMGSPESELQLARKECNVATAVALGSRSAVLQRDKTEVCDKYRALKK